MYMHTYNFVIYHLFAKTLTLMAWLLNLHCIVITRQKPPPANQKTVLGPTYVHTYLPIYIHTYIFMYIPMYTTYILVPYIMYYPVIS